jgi:LPXTG-site transpeptidase (sortase) family protein
VAIALILLGIVIVVVGIFLWLNRPQPKAVLPNPQPIVTPIFPTAESGPPGYRVKIAELGIDLPIVEGDGWTVPLYKAAHYPGMKQPGEGGRSLLYAHAQTGMFGPLLAPGGQVGEAVVVQRPGKPDLNYKISRVVPRWPAGDTSVLAASTKEELVLLTCTSYNANDPRVVVFAQP